MAEHRIWAFDAKTGEQQSVTTPGCPSTLPADCPSDASLIDRRESAARRGQITVSERTS